MKTPDYIEPMLLAALPYTTTGKRDTAAAIAWDIDKALNAAGYVIVPKKSTHEMDTAGQSALKPRIPLSKVHGMYDAMLAAKP